MFDFSQCRIAVCLFCRCIVIYLLLVCLFVVKTPSHRDFAPICRLVDSRALAFRLVTVLKMSGLRKRSGRSILFSADERGSGAQSEQNESNHRA